MSNQQKNEQTNNPKNTTPATSGFNSNQAPAGEKNSSSQAGIVSLPKGGGAVKGIGEKFQANPVTGTAWECKLNSV